MLGGQATDKLSYDDKRMHVCKTLDRLPQIRFGHQRGVGMKLEDSIVLKM